jgi:predicted acylesterase/phospholipase RssA
MFEAVAFAGGGNRCYWQGGFWHVVAPALGLQPRLKTGVSAGAFVACYTTLGLGEQIMRDVVAACRTTRREIDWSGPLTGRPAFPVGPMYRDLLASVITPERFEALLRGPETFIALTRPPKGWPPALAATLGLLVYQIEKKLTPGPDKRATRRMGYRQHLVRLQDCPDAAALVDVLMASAAVPPFTPVGDVGGPALDGGLTQNPALGPLLPVEQAGGRTLVLMTRSYADLPVVENRVWAMPSGHVGVSQFAITDPDGIARAWELGLKDGEAFVRAHSDRA